ncbi:MAG: AI-2E family transporter [Lachnospiraceae bacterium]|nr:AI-2E family transporter [Lachnospiraceae bacterium]
MNEEQFFNQEEQKDKSKFSTREREFLRLCVYAVISILVCVLFIRIIWHWDATKAGLKGLLSSLSPFLVGFFIAYIMGNLSESLDKHILINVFHIEKESARKGLSLVLSYIIVFGIISGALFFIIPALITSITDMAESINGLYLRMLALVNDFSEKHQNPTMQYIKGAIQDSMPQYIEMFKQWATGIAPNLANASMSVVKWILNFIVAIIVSVYMLLDQNILVRNGERIIYATFTKKRADYICHIVGKANEIFSGYIIGKSIDSLIIGIICLIAMKVFNIGESYAIIISIVVGLTNMIPYFGPFLGAIPSIIIIFLAVSPKQALAFFVLIIVLQQFDGNILGPYILGDKTGLRPIWIIFAISIGGWLGGVVGMFLGVPCVAVISSILDEVVDKKLSDKNITDLEALSAEKGTEQKLLTRLYHKYVAGKDLKGSAVKVKNVKANNKKRK